jgi:polypeptide N-acetylgalactosaminyltransferase
MVSDRIARNTTNVACPVIDVINDSNFGFSYQDSTALQVGGFSWGMIVGSY